MADENKSVTIAEANEVKMAITSLTDNLLAIIKTQSEKLAKLEDKTNDNNQMANKAVDPSIDLIIKHIQNNNINGQEKTKNRLQDVVQIVKNLNIENAELTDRVNELTERVESLEAKNKTLSEQLVKLETIQKADIKSIRTLIEVQRKELEEFKSDVTKQREVDEESEV